MEKDCGKMCMTNLLVYSKLLKGICCCEQMEMQVGQTVGINESLCVYSWNCRLCHAELCCTEMQASVRIRSGQG